MNFLNQLNICLKCNSNHPPPPQQQQQQQQIHHQIHHHQHSQPSQQQHHQPLGILSLETLNEIIPPTEDEPVISHQKNDFDIDEFLESINGSTDIQQGNF